MGLVPPMPAVTALATMTDMRNMSTCAESVPAEVCQRVVLSSRWHNWYWADIMYGQSTIYFMCAGLGFFTLLHVLSLTSQRLRMRGTSFYYPDPWWIWFWSSMRYLSSRQFRLSRTRGYTLTLGQSALVGVLILFFSVITLGPKPYYWPNPTDFGYSPPIATRAGFLAIAVLPFQTIFAAKWNPITVLTGVSHEKLQVYHRWLAWIMFVLSLIHTFPFIIVDVQTGMMRMYWRTDWYTVSGVICLVPMIILVGGFIGPIRDRWYEAGKALHFAMATFFIVMLFLHCGFTLTSAQVCLSTYYFVGFAVTYALSLAIRWGRVLHNGFHRAELRALNGKWTEVRIPTTLHWRPGQHYFVRFFTGDRHALTSHPFTPASVPQNTNSVIRLVINARQGMTRTLLAHAAAETPSPRGVRVLLDGPYGGCEADLRAYDRVMLIGGGTGGTYVSSMLSYLAVQESGRISSITVVYVCRSRLDMDVFKPALEAAAKHSKTPVVFVLHVSVGDSETSDLSDASIAKTSSAGDSVEMLPLTEPAPKNSDLLQEAQRLPPETKLLLGRPTLPQLVTQFVHQTGTCALAVCGPREMVYDVRNAVASSQLRIAKGSSQCVECYLHTEVFEW